MRLPPNFRPRKTRLALFGSRGADPAFAELDSALTRLTAGVLRFIGHGTWTAGSEVGQFGGPVERDITNTYMLSVLPEREDLL